MHPNGPGVRRRTYLTLAGAGLAALAGCADAAETGEPTTAETDPEPTTATASPTATETATPERTAAPEHTDTPGADAVDEDALSPAEQSLATVDFEGSWFDTHAHWLEARFFGSEDFTIDDLVAAHRQVDVGASVLFVTPDVFESDFDGTVETLARDAVDYLPFLGPGFSLQRVYEMRSEIFYGMGELPFYEGTPQHGLSFSDRPIPQFRDFAVRNGIPWMIHPTLDQVDDVEQTLADYPELDLMVHGHEFTGTDALLDMLGTYDNLYFTFDLGGQIGPPWTNPASAAEFIDQFETEWDDNLDRHRADLAPMLEAAPTQVMWGTDIVVDWHVDPSFWETIIDYSADLLATLPATHRDPYAYENAVALFGG